MIKHKEIITIERQIQCKHCYATDLHKIGKKKDTQYYHCQECKHKFADNDGYPFMKLSKDLVIRALTFYYNGMSYRNIEQTFDDMFDFNINRSTAYRWIIKYSKMVNDYVLNLKPQLSRTWIADETAVKIWGKQYWFWDIIDMDTRFLIASHLSKKRTIGEATKLFYMAKIRSKTRPVSIRTDKLSAYHKAFNRVFYARSYPSHIQHMTSEGFDSDFNTNLIERFHGTLKQRYKVMRGLKSPASARNTLDGFITHYNFFLEHSYLDYQTPATVSGIGDGIENWGDLIRMSMCQDKKCSPELQPKWDSKFKIN